MRPISPQLKSAIITRNYTSFPKHLDSTLITTLYGKPKYTYMFLLVAYNPIIDCLFPAA